MLRLSSCAPTAEKGEFFSRGKVDGKSRRLLLFSSSCAATRRLPHKKLTGAPSDFRKVDRGSRPGWSACKSTQMRRRTQHSFCSVSPLETQTRRYLAVAFLHCRGWLATVGWDVKTRRRGRLGIGFGLPSYYGVLDALLQTWLCETLSGFVGFGRLSQHSQATELRPSDFRKVDGGSPPPYPAISVPPSGHGVAGPTLQWDPRDVRSSGRKRLWNPSQP